MRILQVNACDVFGGAERVARLLFEGFRDRGHESFLAVAERRSDWRDPHLLDVPDTFACLRPFKRASRYFERHAERFPGAWRLARLFQHLSRPQRWLLPRLGVDAAWNPATARVADLLSPPPDILLGHTLYGYFDLRCLPALCARTHVVLRPADAWLLTGHCSHPRACLRWHDSCGDCPDLAFPPAMGRDRTAANLERKRRIFAHCRLHVATPCRWLMGLVKQSVLAPAVLSSRVIHNGADLDRFRPGNREEERAALDLPADATIALMSATMVRDNACKNFRLAREALEHVAARTERRLLFLALGTDAPPERIGSAEIRFIPFQKDPDRVAAYLRASDLYVHATRADTFPNAVIEALASGLPVIANDVCGIPEQVPGLPPWTGARPAGDEPVGALVPPEDAEAMAAALERLVTDDTLRTSLGQSARRRAEALFDQRDQVNAYLDFFASILADQQAAAKEKEEKADPLA